MGRSKPASNEEIVISIALNVMCSRGWIEEADDELIDDLKRLYHENPLCQVKVKFIGDVMHDMCAGRPGEYLAAAWVCECRDRWQREEAPRWSCPCGVAFGLYERYDSKTDLYTLTDDGLFDAIVTDCPRCKRKLAKVRKEHADGQLGFAFQASESNNQHAP